MDSYVGKAIFNTRVTDCQISKNTLSLYLDGDTAKNMLWQKSDDGTLSFCHKPLLTNVILVYTMMVASKLHAILITRTMA